MKVLVSSQIPTCLVPTSRGDAWLWFLGGGLFNLNIASAYFLGVHQKSTISYTPGPWKHDTVNQGLQGKRIRGIKIGLFRKLSYWMALKPHVQSLFPNVTQSQL